MIKIRDANKQPETTTSKSLTASKDLALLTVSLAILLSTVVASMTTDPAPLGSFSMLFVSIFSFWFVLILCLACISIANRKHE